MIIPVLIVAAIVALDQISKYIVTTHMQLGESFNLVKYILNITYTTNRGASFGILENHRWIFMSLSTVALILMAAGLVYLGLKKFRGNIFLLISVSLIFGGGFSNMINRVISGEVVDMFDFAFVNFAIFNVADSFACIGSVLFFICILTGKYSLFDKSDKTDKINATDKIETTEK